MRSYDNLNMVEDVGEESYPLTTYIKG